MILTDEEVNQVWDVSDGRCPFGTHATLPRDEYGLRWEIDLLVPTCRGGNRSIDNLTALCPKHARMKGDLTAGEFALKMLSFADRVCGH